MILLPHAILNPLPPLQATKHQADPMVFVKFHSYDDNWSWYGIEFDREDRFFGFVDEDFPGLQYFSLAKLKQHLSPMGCHVERDPCFTPRPLSEIEAEIRGRTRRREAK